MASLLLTQTIHYGAPLFSLALFLGALGVPIGASLLVIAAGAFAQQGILPWPMIAFAGLVGTMAGDMLSYYLGHLAQGQVRNRWIHSPSWKSAEEMFHKRGGTAIYLTRFLITLLAVPTNLIAGGSRFGFWRFFLYDLSGEVTWIVLYGGLGYVFGSQWERVGRYVTDFGWFALGVVVLAAGFAMRKRLSKRSAQT